MVLDPADADTTSAGSFFTNPILSGEALAVLRARVGAPAGDAIAVFPEPDGRFKVSAAWLIERAGFSRGFAGEAGRVAVSTKHALALTNRGQATAAELAELARFIQDRVQSEFGLVLQPEPVLVNVEL